MEKLTATDRVVERWKESAKKYLDRCRESSALPTCKRNAISRLAPLFPMTCEEGAHWSSEVDRGFEEGVEQKGCVLKTGTA